MRAVNRYNGVETAAKGVASPAGNFVFQSHETVQNVCFQRPNGDVSWQPLPPPSNGSSDHQRLAQIMVLLVNQIRDQGS